MSEKLKALRYGDTWVRLSNKTTWPRVCARTRYISWLCRYGSTENIEKNRYVIASFIDAFEAMVVGLTQKERNDLCRAIVSVDDNLDEHDYMGFMK
jgi:hypothetical protein